MNISSGELIIGGILAILIQYIIISYAVYNATAPMRKFAKIQAALLCHMARKAGVTEQEIEEAYDLK